MTDYDPAWALAHVSLHSEAIRTCVEQINWPDVLPTPQPNTPYGRQLLTSTDSEELVLIHWRPGAKSAIHDHSGGYGTVFVLQGEIDETSWEHPTALLTAQTPRRTLWSQGSQVSIKSEHVHMMMAAQHRPTVSLHFYIDATQPMTIYDISASRRLLVPPDHGAWIPDEDNILEDISWKNQ